MSSRSIRAIDLFCEVCNWNHSLANAYPEEVENWTRKRDRKLAQFRRAFAKVTKEEFMRGRGACEKDWNEMRDFR